MRQHRLLCKRVLLTCMCVYSLYSHSHTYCPSFSKEPVGVVLCIAPWNFPLLTSINCIIPAILAGNSVVIKHSPRSPLCADAFATVFKAAGAPEDLVTALTAATTPWPRRSSTIRWASSPSPAPSRAATPVRGHGSGHGSEHGRGERDVSARMRVCGVWCV